MRFPTPPQLWPFNRWLQQISIVQVLTGFLVFQLLGLLTWWVTWPTDSASLGALNGNDRVELSFVVAEEEVQPWRAVVGDFEATHPLIGITLVSDPNNQSTDERARIYQHDFTNEHAARHDLVYMDSMWTPQFADYLIDLRSRIARGGDDFLADFLEDDITIGEYGDGLYRIPMRSDIGVLYYRKDLLAHANVTMPIGSSVQMGRLNGIAKAVQLSGQADSEGLNYPTSSLKSVDSGAMHSYLWQGQQYEGLVVNFLEVLHGFGGEWIDEQNQVRLNEEAAYQAAQTLQQLITENISPEGVTDYNEMRSLAAFKQGQTLFLRGWPGFWGRFQDVGHQDSNVQNTTDSMIDLTDQVAMTLPFSFTDKPGVGCRGGWGFGIPKNGAHPDQAWEAIKYFTSEAAQKTFVLASSGYLPSRRSLFHDPEIVATFEWMPQVLDYLDHSSVFRPSISNYSDASEILQKALHDIIEGESVRETLAKAQQETEALLNIN